MDIWFMRAWEDWRHNAPSFIAWKVWQHDDKAAPARWHNAEAKVWPVCFAWEGRRHDHAEGIAIYVSEVAQHGEDSNA